MGLSSLVKSQAVGGLSADLLAAADTTPVVMSQVEVDDEAGSAESQIVRQRVFGDGCTRLSNIFIPLPSTVSSGPLSHAHLRRLRLKKRKHSRPISWVEDQVEIFKQPSAPGGNAYLNRFKILQQIRIAHARRIPSRVRAVEEAFEERRNRSRDEVPKSHASSVVPVAYRQLHPIETANWEDSIVYDADEVDSISEAVGLWIQVKPVSRANAHHGKAFPRPPSLVPAMVQPGSGLVSPLLRPPGAMALNGVSPATSAVGSLSSIGSNSRSASNTSLPSTSSTIPAHVNILKVPQCPATRVLNAELMQGRWLDAICWDDDRLPALLPPLRLILTVSDPTMCLELSTASQAVGQVSAKDLARLNRMIVKAKAKRLPSGSNISLPAANAHPSKQVIYSRLQVHDPLNLSLDRHYERRRNNKTMASLDESRPSTATTSAATSRPSIATSLQHSIPALKLCWPQYRTHWSRQEIRRWHRPALAQPLGAGVQNVTGCKPPGQPKKQEALANGLIRSLKRLTLRDCIEYAMIEYAEEFPLAVMNVGMATRITAYHRVRGEGVEEEERVFENPPPHGGIWQRLGPNDPSPFWQFGFLPVGQTQMALTNNLFRVPCWSHPTPPTDFLLIRHCKKGQVDSKWSLRELPPTVLVAGQVMPLQEVPQPHSRRLNQFCRARVQVAAYRLFHRKQKGEEGKKIAFNCLVGAKLKITKLSNMFPQFSDGSMRKWLKEYADSQRAGTGGSGTWSLRTDAPRLSEDDLRQLVPPEAVCLYESMLVGQQCLQDAGVLMSGDLGEEDERQEVRMAPWNRTAAFVAACAGKCQLRTSDHDSQLSMIKMPTRMTKQEKERMAGELIGPDGRLDRLERERMQTSYRQQLSQIWERQLRWLGGNEQPAVEARPISPTVADGNRLVITRYRDTPNGTVIETDTLTDPRLIAMYLKARQQWQERSARKRAKEATQSQKRATTVGVEKAEKKPRKPRAEKTIGESKKQLTIRCGTCGQQGHMRTNRICPMYAVYEASLLTETKTPAAPKKTSKPKPVPVASLTPAQQLALSRLNNLFHQLLGQLSALPMAWPFAKPVSRKEYPHYYAIIPMPIDLASMKTRCKRQAYRSRQAFQLELERIHANCLTFNLSDHPFTGMAWDLVQRGGELLEAQSAEIERLERELVTFQEGVVQDVQDASVHDHDDEEVSVE